MEIWIFHAVQNDKLRRVQAKEVRVQIMSAEEHAHKGRLAKAHGYFASRCFAQGDCDAP